MLKNTATFIIVSVFIQIIFFKSSTSDFVYDCDPLRDCARSFGGGKVGNPEDCFGYFYCVDDPFGNNFPAEMSFKCDEGYYFDRFYTSCQPGLTCEDQCLKLCQTECTDYIYEKIPDYNDCSSYYICLPGRVKSHHKCPDWKPYFDGSECRKESYACCDCCDECTPFCKVKNTEIADPYDCRSYYLCLDTGYPATDMKFTCEEGKYFEPSIGRCRLEYGLNECKPKCS